MTRVYLLSGHSLLSRGIMNLARQDPALQIVGTGSQLPAALAEIKVLRPDVVVLEYSNCEMADQALFQLHALRELAPPCVVGLDLNSNAFWVYTQEQRALRDLDDFLNTLRQPPPTLAGPHDD